MMMVMMNMMRMKRVAFAGPGLDDVNSLSGSGCILERHLLLGRLGWPPH